MIILEFFKLSTSEMYVWAFKTLIILKPHIHTYVPYILNFVKSNQLYTSFYFPQPKEALPHSSKYTKPMSVEGPLQPSSGRIPLPQEYMNLRAPPPGTLSAPAPQQHYLPSVDDVYHKLAYTAAGPSSPPPTAMPQHSPPPLSQALINTKSSKVPVLHLLPPGPPGPTVAPIIKHKVSWRERRSRQ